MKREIKFRGWDKEQSKILTHEEIDELDKGGIAHWMDIIKPNNRDGIDVMQYTGLKDRNGKEIYEGDVVKVESDKPMVVEWSKRFASFVLNRDGWMYSHWFGESCEPEKCEVVGNIYENPELLNSDKEAKECDASKAEQGTNADNQKNNHE